MDWPAIKQELYFEDGSVRDIIADGEMTLKKWEALCGFLQANHKVSVTCDGNALEDAFDFVLVKRILFDGEHSYIASFQICNVWLQFYFNLGIDHLELDFFPREVDSYVTHMAIIDFMAQLANLLQLGVKMTGELCHDKPLLEIAPKIRT